MADTDFPDCMDIVLLAQMPDLTPRSSTSSDEVKLESSGIVQISIRGGTDAIEAFIDIPSLRLDAASRALSPGSHLNGAGPGQRYLVQKSKIDNLIVVTPDPASPHLENISQSEWFYRPSTNGTVGEPVMHCDLASIDFSFPACAIVVPIRGDAFATVRFRRFWIAQWDTIRAKSEALVINFIATR
jgi:hypothetical protein